MAYESIKWLHIVCATLVVSGILLGGGAFLTVQCGRQYTQEVAEFARKLQQHAILWLTLPGLLALLATGMHMVQIATYDLKDWWLAMALLAVPTLWLASMCHYIFLLRSQKPTSPRATLLFYTCQIATLFYILYLMVCKID